MSVGIISVSHSENINTMIKSSEVRLQRKEEKYMGKGVPQGKQKTWKQQEGERTQYPEISKMILVRNEIPSFS